MRFISPRWPRPSSTNWLTRLVESHPEVSHAPNRSLAPRQEAIRPPVAAANDDVAPQRLPAGSLAPAPLRTQEECSNEPASGKSAALSSRRDDPRAEQKNMLACLLLKDGRVGGEPAGGTISRVGRQFVGGRHKIIMRPDAGAKGPAAAIGDGGEEMLSLGAKDRSVGPLLLDLCWPHAAGSAPD